MSKQTYYRQCHLKKKDKDESYFEQTSYIPEPFCVKGKVLKLRENGTWDDGWIVTFVSELKVAEDMLPDSYQQIKGHKKRTGDSAK